MAIFKELKKHYPTVKDLITAFTTLGDDFLFEQMKSVKIRGYLTQEEFMRICLWKSPRPKPKYKKNSEDRIKIVTQEAIAFVDESKKINSLIKLDGVQIATASAILTAIEPENYGVIDIRVWEMLHYYEVISISKKTGFTVKDWQTYLNVMRKFAVEYGVSVRKIEAALFLASQRNQEGNLY